MASSWSSEQGRRRTRSGSEGGCVGARRGESKCVLSLCPCPSLSPPFCFLVSSLGASAARCCLPGQPLCLCWLLAAESFGRLSAPVSQPHRERTDNRGRRRRRRNSGATDDTTPEERNRTTMRTPPVHPCVCMPYNQQTTEEGAEEEREERRKKRRRRRNRDTDDEATRRHTEWRKQHKPPNVLASPSSPTSRSSEGIRSSGSGPPAGGE